MYRKMTIWEPRPGHVISKLGYKELRNKGTEVYIEILPWDKQC